MSRTFVAVSLVYLAAMLVWVYVMTSEGFSREESFRMGCYTYIVGCSLLVGLSAFRYLLLRWMRRELQLLRWPPMLVVLVIFWLTAKAGFFLHLWLYATDLWRSGFMLTASLTVFAVANGLLTGVWLYRRGMDAITEVEDVGVTTQAGAGPEDRRTGAAGSSG